MFSVTCESEGISSSTMVISLLLFVVVGVCRRLPEFSVGHLMGVSTGESGGVSLVTTALLGVSMTVMGAAESQC